RGATCYVDQVASRNAAIRAAIGIARRRVPTASADTRTVTDAEVLVRNSTCVSRSCAGHPTEAAIRVADIARPAMEARVVFQTMAVLGRTTADRMVRRATAAVGVPRAAVAVTTVAAVVGTRAEVEEAIPAVAGTPVAAVIPAVTTKHQLL